MNIEIVLEPDVPPAQLAELAVAAENYGIRALWASNFWAHWDGFISLVQAALATRTIELGVLAVSPWEMHPLKIANAISSLNEISEGRSMVAIGAGGGMLAAMGKPLNPKKQRIVRAVREAIELVQSVASGERHSAYEGEIFELTRPHHLKWIQHRPARIYACSTEDQMLRMGARVADSLQMSDATLRMLPAAMESIKVGLAKRDAPADGGVVGGVMDSVTLGVTWMWNPNTRVKVDFIYADVEDGPKGTGSIFNTTLRFQWDF